jgi:hypothetical protein
MGQVQDVLLEKEVSYSDGLEFSQFPSSPLAKPQGSVTIQAKF